MDYKLVSHDIKRVRKVKKIKKTAIVNKIIEYKLLGNIEAATELQKLLIHSIRKNKIEKIYSSNIETNDDTQYIINKYYYNLKNI